MNTAADVILDRAFAQHKALAGAAEAGHALFYVTPDERGTLLRARYDNGNRVVRFSGGYEHVLGLILVARDDVAVSA